MFFLVYVKSYSYVIIFTIYVHTTDVKQSNVLNKAKKQAPNCDVAILFWRE